jgi:hypothetical protein
MKAHAIHKIDIFINNKRFSRLKALGTNYKRGTLWRNVNFGKRKDLAILY